MTGAAAVRPARYVTGANDPFTGVAFPTKGTWPQAIQLKTNVAVPVAITASNISGDSSNTWLALSSSNYLSKFLRVGVYVYIQDVLSKVVGVNPDGSAIQLEKAFPSAVSAVNVYVAKNMGAKRIQAISSGTASASLNGFPFPVGEVAVFEGNLGVEAIFYDASATNAKITFDISL